MRLSSLWTMSLQLLSPYRRRCPFTAQNYRQSSSCGLEGVLNLARWFDSFTTNKTARDSLYDCLTGSKHDQENRRPQPTIWRQPLEITQRRTASRMARCERPTGEQTNIMFFSQTILHLAPFARSCFRACSWGESCTSCRVLRICTCLKITLIERYNLEIQTRRREPGRGRC